MASDEASSDEERPTKPLMDTTTGLPLLTQHEKEAGEKASIKMLVMTSMVPRIIFTSVAFGIYYSGRDVYDVTMTTMLVTFPAGALSNLGFLYIGIGLYSYLSHFLNFYPMLYKAQVMPGNSGNLRANMQIYKLNFVGESIQKYPYVVMEEEGEIGKYNRANRALHHFTENAMALGAQIIAAGLIFPLVVGVLTLLYVIARMWYQIAYSSGGYGLGCCKHALPFMLSNMIVAPIIEGLVWVAGACMLAHIK